MQDVIFSPAVVHNITQLLIFSFHVFSTQLFVTDFVKVGVVFLPTSSEKSWHASVLGATAETASGEVVMDAEETARPAMIWGRYLSTCMDFAGWATPRSPNRLLLSLSLLTRRQCRYQTEDITSLSNFKFSTKISCWTRTKIDNKRKACMSMMVRNASSASKCSEHA